MASGLTSPYSYSPPSQIRNSLSHHLWAISPPRPSLTRSQSLRDLSHWLELQKLRKKGTHRTDPSAMPRRGQQPRNDGPVDRFVDMYQTLMPLGLIGFLIIRSLMETIWMMFVIVIMGFSGITVMVASYFRYSAQAILTRTIGQW